MMTTPDPKADVPVRRRPTVRIIKPRGSRATTISILVTVATAAVLFFVWRFWHEDEKLLVTRRSLEDVRLEWKCDAGHRFSAQGQPNPRACPRCGRPAYPVGTYRCPEHGALDVRVRYAVTPDGLETPSEFRVEGGDWGPPETALICPICKRPLRRERKNPLEADARNKKTRRP